MNAKAATATQLVVMPAAELSELVKRAVGDALAANQSAPLLVDTQTMAQRLGCSAAHITNLRKRGLPVIHLGEAVRFDPNAVMAWLLKASKSE